ncbi:MAG: S1 RNA-binding domain-containing protein [Xanthomonadaceae bacterium]|nr:S1 RNA-binding domain-containing protein [Rhodospirillaceae bacterium]NIA17692.1 S1 RNA-binding domain-containing protein [Xanthomonadaceae bacterium]
MDVKIKKKKNENEFKKLLEKNLVKLPKVGDTVKGTVLNVSKREIHINIDGITTGLVRGYEMIDESEEYTNIKKGDEIEAMVLELENEKGEIELSLRKAGHQKAWENLHKLYEEKKKLNVKIIDANKGGLLVMVGKTKGFLPVSQLSTKHYPRVSGGDKTKILDKLKSFVGETFEAIIINLDEKEEKLIISEKQAMQEKQKKQISKYKIGDVVEGIVSAITNFGIFIKFNGLEGLIHISEIAWQRIDNPEDLVKIGDKIKAEIIEINGIKIFLSIKKITNDPWKNIDKKYKLGDIIEGEILKINPFGLFVKLDENIHGLAHISELSDKNIDDLKTFTKVGEKKKFKIVSIEPSDHRLGLSIRALKKDYKRKDEEKKNKKNKEKNPLDDGKKNIKNEEKEKKEKPQKQEKKPEKKQKNTEDSKKEDKKNK